MNIVNIYVMQCWILCRLFNSVLLQKLASNLETTRQVYEKVLGETEDFMAVLHNREKDQTEYEQTMRWGLHCISVFIAQLMYPGN